MFSRRTDWDTREDSLAGAVRERRERGEAIYDLTVSNPTVCGFEYAAEEILGALTSTDALIYDPDPKGLRTAREAVAGYYRERGAEVDPSHLVLTTSTSEAYSFLFRLLCDPSDQVMVANPSYPLFDLLSDLENVVLQPYPLFYDFGWWIDFAELERHISPRTRAILLVHPNNPTGHATTRAERYRVEAICARHGLALIVDEVFLDYGLTEEIASFATGPHRCLTFVVSGLSKVAALPQMKVGWLAAFGPGREEAVTRLEVIADTFLSMNAPVQLALPTWLAGGERTRRQLVERVRANLAVLDREAIAYLPVEAGWNVVMQVPQRIARSVEGVALTLAKEAGVLTYPASFYGMAMEHGLVLSLIGKTEPFKRGVEGLKRWCESKELTLGGSHSSIASGN